MNAPDMSLNDVFNAVLLEESKPDYAVLLRWTERYPQYRDDLRDFFATWAIQSSLPPEMEPEIDEDRVTRKVLEYALKLARDQGRIAPERKVPPIGSFDQLVLAAIFRLHTEAWSGAIVEELTEMTGKQVRFGPVFSSLARMKDQGLLAIRVVHVETERESKGRRYYTITRFGERALVEARKKSVAVAAFLPELA